MDTLCRATPNRSRTTLRRGIQNRRVFESCLLYVAERSADWKWNSCLLMTLGRGRKSDWLVALSKESTVSGIVYRPKGGDICTRGAHNLDLSYVLPVTLVDKSWPRVFLLFITFHTIASLRLHVTSTLFSSGTTASLWWGHCPYPLILSFISSLSFSLDNVSLDI